MQEAMSGLHPIATTKADIRKRSCLLYPPKADMCGALAHVCFGPIADIEEFGAQPGTNVPGSFFARLVLGPMSVGSVVIVTWTAVIVGTTTVIGWTATITVVVSTVIRSGSISVAVISRTIVVRP